MATELLEVVDLAERPTAVDDAGWWAIRGEFSGPVLAYRFGRVVDAPMPEPAQPWVGLPADAWTSSLDRAGYLQRIARIRELIEAGDVYQVNLCRVLQARLPSSADPVAMAAVLQAGNPAAYQGLLVTGTEWVVTASPELFLDRDGDMIESAPIKGTAAEDSAFLPKDLAENVMITDLVRNDLNRICRSDSVEVAELLATESYPGLLHLVSTVRGRLRPGVGWAEIFAACFPPGSVSGAPKFSALRAISELESVPRDVYCGAIGYIDSDAQTAEIAVGIRTFFTSTDSSGERWLNFGTGAGITYPSDPEAEWRETVLKAGKLISLVSAPDPHSAPAAR